MSTRTFSRLAVLFCTMLALMAPAAGASLAQATVTCDNFTSQAAAQLSLNDDNADALDSDGDGVACESLPDSASSNPAGQGDDTTIGTGNPQDVSPCTGVLDNTVSNAHIGTTRAEFEAVYGSPVDTEFSIEYDIDGCGTVFAAYFEDETTTSIMVFSPRTDNDKDFQEPDSADWTLVEAEQIARNFLPGDAQDTGAFDIDNFRIVEGESDYLLQSVPTAAYDYVDNSREYGGYSYSMFTTDAGEVSWIIISLEIEEDDPL